MSKSYLSIDKWYYRLAPQMTFAILLTYLLFGIFIPIYTDEVGWRFQVRAGYDGYDYAFSDYCGSNTNAVPPLFMMPARYFSYYSSLIFSDAVFIRLIGVLNAIIWVMLFRIWIRSTVRHTLQGELISHLSLNLLALGLFPALFVWSRPEQPMNLSLLTALILYSKSLTFVDDWNSRRLSITLLAVVVLFALNLSYHPKAILLSPIFFVIFFEFIKRLSNHLLQIGASGLVIALFASAYFYWTTRYQCPNDHLLSAELAKQNLIPALSGVNSLSDIFWLFVNSNNITQYFVHLAFASPNKTMSTWIYSENLPDFIAILSQLIIVIIWITFIYVIVTHIVISMIKKERKNLHAMPMVLAICLSISSISSIQLVKNAYEITLIAPLLLFIAIYTIQIYPFSVRVFYFLKPLNLTLTVLVALNFIGFLVFYSPRLIETAHQYGYIKDQLYSQSSFKHKIKVEKIYAVAQLCNIYNAPSTNNILVDDITYLAFTNSTRPYHAIGVIGPWNGSIHDPLAYLRSVNSQGIILGCDRFPDYLKPLTKGDGEFCCISL